MAFQLALNYLNSKDTVFRHGKKMIVSKGFTFTPESFSIAFQFDIDVSFIEQWRISIDARNGNVVNKVSLVNTCFDRRSSTASLWNRNRIDKLLWKPRRYKLKNMEMVLRGW